jgi:glycolate oxidase
MDGTIPKRHLSDILEKISELSKHYKLRVANVFHAGDGNLHPLILYDANIAGELERTEAFGKEILKACVDAGGTITGEHGVGIEKLDAMCYQFGTAELAIFHQIKQIFDPSELLNPGKAIPTLHRCAEFGAMHVHNGQLPHPEIERF